MPDGARYGNSYPAAFDGAEPRIFTNVIVDDVWVIYYNDLVDEDRRDT